jgi:hypothetical protein
MLVGYLENHSHQPVAGIYFTVGVLRMMIGVRGLEEPMFAKLSVYVPFPVGV